MGVIVITTTASYGQLGSAYPTRAKRPLSNSPSDFAIHLLLYSGDPIGLEGPTSPKYPYAFCPDGLNTPVPSGLRPLGIETAAYLFSARAFKPGISCAP